MLTSKLKSFLGSALGMGMGTCDANLVPDFSRVLGARAIDDYHIQFFIDLPTSTRTLDNLRDNGKLSVVVVEIHNAESYQLKGRFVSESNVTAEELDYINTYLINFDKVAVDIGLLPGILFNYPHSDMITITMEVQEIFEQTPKKGTGQKL
jgi:hypothetical protein